MKEIKGSFFPEREEVINSETASTSASTFTGTNNKRVEIEIPEYVPKQRRSNVTYRLNNATIDKIDAYAAKRNMPINTAVQYLLDAILNKIE
jgi:hypothetical protein